MRSGNYKPRVCPLLSIAQSEITPCIGSECEWSYCPNQTYKWCTLTMLYTINETLGILSGAKWANKDRHARNMDD